MSMKLVAPVRRVAVRGINKVFIGHSPTGEMILEDMPDAIRIEIEINDDGPMLYRWGEGDVFCGDSWHETIELAKQQAAYEFEIEESDWIDWIETCF